MFFLLRAASLALNTLLHDSLHKLPTISQDTVRFVVAVAVVVLAVGYSVTDDPGGSLLFNMSNMLALPSY